MKQKKILFIIGLLLVIGTGVAMVLQAFNEQLVFFYNPSEMQEKLKQGQLRDGQFFRLGGLVEKGTLQQQADSLAMEFTISDGTNQAKVRFTGIAPALFREGQGVVAEGVWQTDGRFFQARRLLAKHDENYMPPEVARSLKKQQLWQHQDDKNVTDGPIDKEMP